MPLLFATTLLLSAILLFSLQPMIARMLLPYLGGTPAVWNTCMVFFQTVLLAGYAYAHAVTTYLKPARQIALHLVLLSGALLWLPVGLGESTLGNLPTEANPVFWLLGSLLSSVGGPFFVVSATAPLLQKWFSQTDHPSAGDPYFLYAASNLGSLVALAGYPALIEPSLTLSGQSRMWAVGYGLFSILMCVLAVLRLRSPPTPGNVSGNLADPASGKATAARASDPATRGATEGAWARWGERGLWTALAFVPSSLLLAVTTYLTTDVASIPLFWVLPLALYLLSFVIVFARRRMIPRAWLVRALPIGAIGLAYLLISEATQPAWLLIALHLAFFFIAALVCHGRLADERPPAARLTEFYLWLSFGGMLGGFFNALVAPIVFSRVTEYPIGVILACLLRPAFSTKRRTDGVPGEPQSAGNGPGDPELGRDEPLVFPCLVQRPRGSPPQMADVASDGAGRDPRVARPDPAMAQGEARKEGGEVGSGSERILGAEAAGAGANRACGRERSLDLAWAAGIGLIAWMLARWIPLQTLVPARWGVVMVVGIPAMLTYFLVDRPVRFGLALGAVLWASSVYPGFHGRTLHAERNFFGVLRITVDPSGRLRRMVHGNTIHGRQFMDPARQCEPLSYYHRTGPLGQIFGVFDGKIANTNVAVVGLGAGSMVCYAQNHQNWTYYEINPAVVRLARNTNYFTFLERCASARVRMVLGDARLRLREAPARGYDLILLDAFSSDAIPTHLVTREALDLYLSKLAEGGLIAFHISNRCLDLQPVLGALAKQAQLVCRAHDEMDPSPAEEADGKNQSHWLVMARRSEDLGRLRRDVRWWTVEPPAHARLWTDDYSDILSVSRWD